MMLPITEDAVYFIWSFFSFFTSNTFIREAKIHPPAEQAKTWTAEITMCLFKEKTNSTHLRGLHSFVR